MNGPIQANSRTANASRRDRCSLDSGDLHAARLLVARDVFDLVAGTDARPAEVTTSLELEELPF